MSLSDFSAVLPTSEDAYTIFNMNKQEITVCEQNMRPGALSSAGFLSDKDSLEKVYVKDLTFLAKEGISCDKIADTLFALIEKAKELKDRFKLTGSGLATNGFQTCPFKHCHKGRRDYVVTNLKTNESLSFSDLGIELIRKHAFFQGDTDYRIDPKKAIRVLEIKPGPYERVKKEILVWKRPEEGIEKAEAYAKKHAKRKFEDEEVTAYYAPYADFEKHKCQDEKEEEDTSSFDTFFLKDSSVKTASQEEEGDFVHIIKKKAVIKEVEGIPLDKPLDIDHDAIFVYEKIVKTWANI